MTNLPEDNHNSQSGWSKYLDLLRKYISVKLLLSIVFLALFGIGLIYISHGKTSDTGYYLLQEIGKGIFITAIVTGTIKLYMTTQFNRYEDELKVAADSMLHQQLKVAIDKVHSSITNAIDTKPSKIQSSVDKSLDKLDLLHTMFQKNFTILDALKEAGATRFYKNREEASKYIRHLFENNPGNYIKIIGISLKEFFSANTNDYYYIWKTISNKMPYHKNAEKLTVRILIIDPNCHGATLRRKAEETNGAKSSLHSDVEAAMKRFLALKNKNSEKFDFDARIYQTPPILHLFWTQDISFAQHYYMRPADNPDINIPVIRYEKDELKNENSIHSELGFHFDFLWDNASVPIEEYLNEHYRGTNKGILMANIRQISYSSDLNKDRFISHINNTKNILYIKGVTLKSFFAINNNALFSSIEEAVKRNVKIRVLILDPTCEQALYRSYREYLIPPGGKKSFDAFKKTNEVYRQRLYTDFEITKNSIGSYFSGIDNFQARCYKCSTEAFLLITDDVAMVEQYHYGKIYSKNVKSLVLSGSVPMIEYYNPATKPTPLKNPSGAKNPYGILLNHFNHVFDNYSEDLVTKNQGTENQ